MENGEDTTGATTAANARWFSREDAFRYLDVDADNRERVRLLLSGLADGTSRGRLLDVGCGDGRIAERIARLGYEVTGLDASRENAELARTRGIDALVGDAADALRFADGAFATVVAGEIVEHLVDAQSFLREAARVLAPGGRLVVTTPNLAHLPDRLRFVLGKAPMQTQPLHPFLKLHIRPFAPDTLRASLVEAGFAVDRIESTMVVFARDPRDEDRVRLKSRTIARLFPSLGSTLIAWARKR
ncbi:MAG: methyltransferase domain-containing protein [Sandaracinaceae bacterium]